MHLFFCREHSYSIEIITTREHRYTRVSELKKATGQRDALEQCSQTTHAREKNYRGARKQNLHRIHCKWCVHPTSVKPTLSQFGQSTRTYSGISPFVNAASVQFMQPFFQQSWFRVITQWAIFLIHTWKFCPSQKQWNSLPPLNEHRTSATRDSNAY